MATMSFFSTAVIVSQVYHRESLPLTADADWSLGDRGGHLYALTVVLVPFLMAMHRLPNRALEKASSHESSPRLGVFKSSLFRSLTCLLTSLTFGISLSLGNMVDPQRVLAFLVLPVSRAFDPTLAFLAGSALPLSVLLYRYGRPHRPCFGETWATPSNTKIDARLVGGSVLFGIGWGICGVCRECLIGFRPISELETCHYKAGPALVNFGRALYTGENISVGASWLLAMLFGGFAAGRCF